MFDVIIPLFLRHPDEKEEIDLPVLRLTPEPMTPDPSYFGTEASPCTPTSPVSSPSKESTPKDQSSKSSSYPHQPSSPSVIGQSVSQITGIKPVLTHTNSLAKLPKYGVEMEKEEEVTEIVKNIDRWGMDMMRVRELSNGHPLLTIVYTILRVSEQSCELLCTKGQNTVPHDAFMTFWRGSHVISCS